MRIRYGAIMLLAIFAGGCDSSGRLVGPDERANLPREPDVQMMPEVAVFLSSYPTIPKTDQNPEFKFGTATTIRNVSNWERGKRQLIKFDSGSSLLFYEKNGVVVTVYDLSHPEGVLRLKLWGEYGRKIVNTRVIETGVDPDVASSDTKD